jgi:hypothetical protein
MSTDCSREYGVLGPSEDDTESSRERFPMTVVVVCCVRLQKVGCGV